MEDLLQAFFYTSCNFAQAENFGTPIDGSHLVILARIDEFCSEPPSSSCRRGYPSPQLSGKDFFNCLILCKFSEFVKGKI
jgi:hypothetical protein